MKDFLNFGVTFFFFSADFLEKQWVDIKGMENLYFFIVLNFDIFIQDYKFVFVMFYVFCKYIYSLFLIFLQVKFLQ